jgi:hypothetical protein
MIAPNHRGSLPAHLTAQRETVRRRPVGGRTPQRCCSVDATDDHRGVTSITQRTGSVSDPRGLTSLGGPGFQITREGFQVQYVKDMSVRMKLFGGFDAELALSAVTGIVLIVQIGSVKAGGVYVGMNALPSEGMIGAVEVTAERRSCAGARLGRRRWRGYQPVGSSAPAKPET